MTITTSYLPREAHTPASQSNQLNEPWCLNRSKSTGAGQAVIRRHTASLEVGQREDREADEGGHSHGETSSGMEAG